MALSDSDIARIKYHLAFNVLSIGALPYIGHVAIFDVIQDNVPSDTTTTSSTSVTATGGAATPVALTLASATGFASGQRVIVDVGVRQEVTIVQSVSGSVVTAALALDHSGTYPVTIEGPESLIREILRQLDALSGFGGSLSSSASSAGIKKVDEIEFFGNASASGIDSRVETMEHRQMRLRDELSALTGVPNGWRYRGRNGSVALY